MKLYKNGVLMGIKSDGGEPNVLTRTNHNNGAAKSDAINSFFDGTIAYINIWDVELTAHDVTDLYSRLVPVSIGTPVPSPAPPTSTSGLSSGDKIGIIVGSVLCAVLVLVALLYRYRLFVKSKNRQAEPSVELQQARTGTSSEIESSPVAPVYAASSPSGPIYADAVFIPNEAISVRTIGGENAI